MITIKNLKVIIFTLLISVTIVLSSTPAQASTYHRVEGPVAGYYTYYRNGRVDLAYTGRAAQRQAGIENGRTNWGTVISNQFNIWANHMFN